MIIVQIERYQLNSHGSIPEVSVGNKSFCIAKCILLWCLTMTQLVTWHPDLNESEAFGCFLQNSERRMLKEWAADTKEELSLANKELTAVSYNYNNKPKCSVIYYSTAL